MKKSKKFKKPSQANNENDWRKFFEDGGDTIRPGIIEYYDDGTHKVTAWNIGKTIDELYDEKVKQINKDVDELEARCYSKLDNEGLDLLKLNLKAVIHLYKYKSIVFKHNPEQQTKLEEHHKEAVQRLENLLNDVVLPTIGYRNTKDKVSTKEVEETKQAFKQKVFFELFHNPDLISECINLLRETAKPCINEENEFQRSKGFFVVWFKAMEYKQMFNCFFSNDRQRAKTLNLNFKNLNISDSLFRSDNSKAGKLMDHFRNEITAIKN